MTYSISIFAGAPAQNEGTPGATGVWTLRFTRDQDLASTSYSIRIFNQDMSPSADFVGGSDQAVTFVGGATTADLTLTAVADGVIEGDEKPVIYLYRGGTPVGQDIAFTQAITITNDDFAPAFTSGNFTAAENGTAVGTVAATAGGPITYAISGGADQALFGINATTGVLTFNGAHDFDAAADDANGDKIYELQVRASSGAATTQNITVTLTNVNEAITITGGAGPINTSIAENTQDVVAVAATDLDATDTVTWSFSGPDAGKFQVAGGMLRFITAPDADVAGDVGADNVYNVTVRATDSGGLFSEQVHAVTITGVNEPARITSYAGASVLALRAPENTPNTTTLATVTAVDPEADAIAWSTVGPDAAAFTAVGGVLKFTGSPDFEAPGSVDGDNTYDVSVRATSTGGTADQRFLVFIDNVVEAGETSGGGGGVFTPPSTPTPVNPVTPAPGAGDDSILGTSSGDTRDGGPGNDTIDGGLGDDCIDGGTGGDRLIGGEGNDFIRGLNDDDVVQGGAGDDTVNGNLGQDIVDGGDGRDSVYGGQGNDTVNGGNGDDPYVNGNIGNDIVHGDAGNDSVYGGQNDDVIYGDDGNDLLSGDLGNDLMYGGDGADRFTIAPGGGADWVIDFNGTAGDRIQLAPGTGYSIGSYQGQVLITLTGGGTIGLAGVSSIPSDWVIFG